MAMGFLPEPERRRALLEYAAELAKNPDYAEGTGAHDSVAYRLGEYQGEDVEEALLRLMDTTEDARIRVISTLAKRKNRKLIPKLVDRITQAYFDNEDQMQYLFRMLSRAGGPRLPEGFDDPHQRTWRMALIDSLDLWAGSPDVVDPAKPLPLFEVPENPMERLKRELEKWRPESLPD